MKRWVTSTALVTKTFGEVHVEPFWPLQVDTAVLVLLDEMFPKLKYLQLRKRLCRKSVLSWPRNPKAQPLFWNQVRMALSSDNVSFYDDKMSQSFS